MKYESSDQKYQWDLCWGLLFHMLELQEYSALNLTDLNKKDCDVRFKDLGKAILKYQKALDVEEIEMAGEAPAKKKCQR